MSVDEFGRMFNARLNLLWWGCKAAICLSFRPLCTAISPSCGTRRINRDIQASNIKGSIQEGWFVQIEVVLFVERKEVERKKM